MSKKPKGYQNLKTVGAVPAPGAASLRPTAPPLRFAAGVLFAALATLMSLLLTLDHFGGLRLPGCGEGSPCHQAANSVWGKVPGINWPVSYLGLAYFLAVLVAWVASRGVLPATFRWLVRLGVLGSVFFCAVIAYEKLLCAYCLATHAGNLAFWITLELTRTRGLPSGRALSSAAAVFLLATAVLAVWDRQVQKRVRAAAEQDRDQSLRQMIDRTHQQPPADTASSPARAPISEPRVPSSERAQPPPELGTQNSELASGTRPASQPAFIGRYPWGPPEAPIRIVMFTGYQCRDCAMIERQVQLLQKDRNDICLSIKHFPFNSDCNPAIRKTTQPNGCWAARAAEAAGMLWGADGFWKMHHWLFARQGVFETAQQLEDGIRSLGYDPAGFIDVMQSEATLAAIREDAAEAQRLGLFFTPMIFINGVELKGWNAPMALVRTVEELAATNPPPGSPTQDRPPSAFEKYIADWRDGELIELPPDDPVWTLGPPEGAIKIVVWGDYQEPTTAEADQIIRAFVGSRRDARYTFRHCPASSDCNPNFTERRHPLACRAASAAEAAGRLAGNDGYWTMHTWLMENQKQFGDDALRAAATRMGLDPDALLAAMDRDDVKRSIVSDVQMGARLPPLRIGAPAGIHNIPTIFVNGRYVPRWKLGERAVLRDILEAAATR